MRLSVCKKRLCSCGWESQIPRDNTKDASLRSWMAAAALHWAEVNDWWALMGSVFSIWGEKKKRLICHPLLLLSVFKVFILRRKILQWRRRRSDAAQTSIWWILSARLSAFILHLLSGSTAGCRMGLGFRALLRCMACIGAARFIFRWIIHQRKRFP